jgi:hypothetical protein
MASETAADPDLDQIKQVEQGEINGATHHAF